MRAASFIVALMLAACAAPHGYLGIQRVTPMNRIAKGKEVDNGGAYFNLLFPMGDRWSFQIEPIIPFNGGEPALRLAADCKLF